MIGDTGNAPAAAAAATVGARTAAASILSSGVGGWTSLMAGGLPVDGVMVGGTTCPATVNLGLSVGKHNGTVRIGRTAVGAFVVGTLSTSTERLTGLGCEDGDGVGRLIHKSSGASSSKVTGRGRLVITSRASSSRRRRVFILRSVGASSLAGGTGTERV